jgi:hypothetical protein
MNDAHHQINFKAKLMYFNYEPKMINEMNKLLLKYL